MTTYYQPATEPRDRTRTAEAKIRTQQLRQARTMKRTRIVAAWGAL